MKLPALAAHSVSRDMISTFGGYHHHSTVPDNSFYDMKNLSSDHYPALSIRKARGIFKNGQTNDDGTETEIPIVAPSAMVYTDRLCYTDGSALIIGAERIECGLSTASSMLPKKLVSMGTYIIVFPDRYYINTADTSDCGEIAATFDSRRFLLDGETVSSYYEYSIHHCNESGETEDDGGNAFTKTSGYFLLRCAQFSQAEDHLYKAFKALYECGFIRGQRLIAKAVSSNPDMEESATIPILKEVASGLFAVVQYDISDAAVYAVTGDGIVFKGVPKYKDPSYSDYSSENGSYEYGFTLKGSSMPDMDFIFEHENRLWGCRYGMNALGEMINEIYASALGSFRDWNIYEGIASDSFVQSVGSDGPFTGACAVNGYPIFFKEKGYHKVYGSYPAEYQVQAVECKGVQKGSDRSMATVNGVLYYKAVDAVCSFDGSYPTDISYSLGGRRYADAVGGSHRYKYYLSMRDIDTDEWSLFVYDALCGLWHKEDDLRAVCFCDTMRALYCIPASGDRILDLTSGEDDEGAIPWSFETGMITSETVDRKFLQNLSVRLSLAVGGTLFTFIEYDSSGRWEYLFRLAGTSTNTFTIPITPQRCDHFRLRFSGTGDMKLFALAKSYTKGSTY